MGYSASASSSATSGNKVGPVTFGGVGFGNQGNAAGSNTMLYVIGAVALAIGGWMFLKKS